MAGESVERVAPGALPTDVEEALGRLDRGLAGKLRYVGEVDSTNDEALRLAAAGAGDGTAVLAGLQRRGRGRRGRTWFSPPGAGVYLSVVVRPCDWTGGASLVTLGAGVAAARAVTAATGLPLELKWPNDLVVGRPWRKLGGVLTEAAGGQRPLDAVVVGIGINLRPAAYPADLADRATAIEVELGRSVDRGALVGALLMELAGVVGRMRVGQVAQVLDEWRILGRAGLRRAPVRWQHERAWRSGLAVDVDDEGALVVETDGRRERLVAGEVFWGRMDSRERA
jgi:BirA family biotin operon repressor/biotin-[acetyl-CoA-carboxylase] ligase